MTLLLRVGRNGIGWTGRGSARHYWPLTRPLRRLCVPQLERAWTSIDPKFIHRGDNLEALKLLQEIYLGEVKLIYADPPYNRKKGTISSTAMTLLGTLTRPYANELIVDESENRLIANTE